MPTISLRKRWTDAYPHLKLSNGIVRGGLADAYIKAAGTADTEIFPHPSVRRLASAALWPRSKLVRVSENPKAAEAVWTDELNALVCDDTYWYAVTKKKLYRIPRSVPLSKAKGGSVEAPAEQPGWPHGGGASLHNGFLYVAVHRDDPLILPTGQVWVVSTSDLTVVDQLEVPDPGLPIQDPTLNYIPFVAIHPRKHLLYSMPYDPVSSAQLRVYRIYPRPGEPGPDGTRLRFLGAVTLTDETGNEVALASIQNAVVTPNEHLLVLCDIEDHPRGLHLFDLVSGRRRWHADIGVYTTEHDYNVLFWDIAWKGWEAEALFVKEMGGDGLIHVGNLDKISATDDLTIADLDFESSDRELL